MVEFVMLPNMQGFLPSTVSKHCQAWHFVETRDKKKVMRAVSDLNYNPNLAARSLKKRRQQADRVLSYRIS